MTSVSSGASTQRIMRRAALKAVQGKSVGSGLGAAGSVEWSIEVIGIKEMLEELERREGNVKRAISVAVRRAGRVVRQEAMRTAPSETGTLAKSIGIRVRTYRLGLAAGRSTVVAIVGPKQDFTASVRRVKVISTRRGTRIFAVSEQARPKNTVHLVALGVRPHQLGSGSSLRKQQQIGHGHPGFAGKDFMRLAADRAASRAGQVMASAIQAAMDGAPGSGGGGGSRVTDLVDSIE